MRRQRHPARGISLIEAVVALAVMAFGMLAYVGLQSTLRFNSDVAKQRSEAVRIAQQAIEDWRAYSVIETAAERKAYDDIPAGNLDPVVVVGENAEFTLQRTVVNAATTDNALLRGAAPRMKTLAVDVSWQDRNGQPQSVRLSTTLTGSPPELAGTLAVPGNGSAQRLPQGRHPAIPVLAKDLGGGLSGYKPAGAEGATKAFVFDNATGMIVGVCNAILVDQEQLTSETVDACKNNTRGLPLSGFVRFATDPVQPTAADAQNPPSTALNLDVVLSLTSVGHPAPAYDCFVDAPASELTTRTVVPYFCAIFFRAGVVPRWSGTSRLTPRAFLEHPDEPWLRAVNAADARLTRYRICRYTPAANDAQVIPNQWHPKNYSNVDASQPLSNQNFLVIRAGDGTVPFICPTDVPANPDAGDFVNSNTLTHQPPPG